MDIIVWFEEAEGNAIASAVTMQGVIALQAILFSKASVYVIQISGKTPLEFIEGLPKGIVACLYVDGLLQELESENKPCN